jgi:dinuclear metal center YbgI/SA1388 family protein
LTSPPLGRTVIVMATDSNIVSGYLDEVLELDAIPDYPQALNGLQLSNGGGSVTKIVAAVDACLPVIREAVALEADLLLVHHGLFWQGAQRIDGSVYDKLKLAMDNGLAIYSAHIPLDVHAEFGNNACLGRALGLGAGDAFFPWKGIQLGLRYTPAEPIARDALRDSVAEAVGAPVHLCPGGPESVSSIGIITGGAGSEVYAMAEQGVDTFITGEGPHWSYTSAEELGLNLVYGGHYATETFGVKAMAAHLAERFAVEWDFVDHPTGL